MSEWEWGEIPTVDRGLYLPTGLGYWGMMGPESVCTLFPDAVSWGAATLCCVLELSLQFSLIKSAISSLLQVHCIDRSL